MNDVRLIDANALLYEGREYIVIGAGDNICIDIADIYAAPTVDAVPVVRCKDCKHWKLIDEHIPHFECNIFCVLHDHGYPTSADDFCSHGERKDDGIRKRWKKERKKERKKGRKKHE